MAKSDGLAKILDPELQNGIRSGSQEVVTILVELEAPEPVLHVSRDAGSARRRIHLATDPSADQAAELEATALGNWIRSIPQTDDLHYLSAARAFVVDIPLSRLTELAESPLVRSIRSNRRRLS
jgi:hypothetical protein